MKFNPKNLCKEYDVSFNVTDLNEIYSADNWPSNLIYNQDLMVKDINDTFYETFYSDTTLTFMVKSAIGRVKSLISRACHNKDKLYEHSDIICIFYDDDIDYQGFVKSKVEVYLKMIKNS